MMTWIAGSTSVIALALTPFVPAPEAAAWPYLLTSIAVHTCYMLLLVRAYRGHFGQVYPVARGMAPLLIVTAGYFLADEELSAQGLAGILLTVLGIVSLARPGRAVEQDVSGLFHAIAVGAMIAAYSVLDGLGGRAAGDPLSYIVYLFLLHGLPVTAIAIALRGRQLIASLRVMMTGFGGAAMSMVAYGIVIWAMAEAPMGPVSALRETGVIFAAMISAWILKEGGGGRVFLAVGLVTTGVILLRLQM